MERLIVRDREYFVEGRPELSVLGVKDSHSFGWVNGDIPGIETEGALCDTLDEKGIPYEWLPVDLGGEPVEALITSADLADLLQAVAAALAEDAS